ncbi:phosphatase PAP2 family protein [Curtobacterium sp. MCBA15_012]|uniref:phosphatase PAP2 family protein n=1 Tax=Curtobacterium sp. MCBA15_012 TaxID=1898738 RepID=UPI0008DCCF85|nr:phosphatase PAP2 family protein [Curtobacterium sp. MCBA15_012]WIB00475.1 phosphatase PAP2 family protein [Curtobacterium sp. MCBA15_012]
MTDAPELRRSRRTADVVGILEPNPYPLVAIAVAVVSVVVLTIIGFFLGTVDLGLSKAFNELHVGALGAFTTAVYHVISPVPAIALTFVVAGVIWWRARDIRPALGFGMTIAITWLPSAAVKEIVHRARPDVALLPHPFPVQPDPGYPSGHTVYITAFVIALVWVVRETRWHRLAQVLGVVAIVVVFLSVSIDAVHYPTDAAASVLWALAVTPAARVVWVDWVMPKVPILRPREGAAVPVRR